MTASCHIAAMSLRAAYVGFLEKNVYTVGAPQYVPACVLDSGCTYLFMLCAVVVVFSATVELTLPPFKVVLLLLSFFLLAGHATGVLLATCF